jgi:hypothetical protein
MTTTGHVERQWLSIPGEVQEATGLGETTVRLLVRNGRQNPPVEPYLHSIRVGRRRMVPVSALREFELRATGQSQRARGMEAAEVSDMLSDALGQRIEVE